ncbi:hypothetical protein C808_05311 [Lachnospiraceae bacterium M18-1]|nr:hypothetical protein C808_05311 [Lachnospiraceae bacterium M18-1]
MDKDTLINNLLANYGKYGVTPDEYFKPVEPQRAAVYYFPNGLH